MDTGRIAQALDCALREGVRPFPHDTGPFAGSFESWMRANNMVGTGDATLEAVVGVLEGEAALGVFRGGAVMARRGSGASLVSFDRVAHWLLAQAFLHGSARAAKKLEEFVGGKHRDTLQVLALAGVSVVKELQLTRAVKLVPFQQVPRWHVTEALGPEVPYLSPYVASPVRTPRATAALVSTVDGGIDLLETWSDYHAQPASYPVQRLLWQMCHCLTLVGPSAPTPIGQWSQPVNPEGVPVMPTGYGWSNTYEEAYPEDSVALPEDVDVPRLMEEYLALTEGARSELDVPLRRLNLALRRQDVVDRAIELGVALEALLVADREGDAPVSYLLRVRGAWLAGGSAEERARNKNLLRDAYKLRSKAVHTGKLDAAAGEVLQRCAALCAGLIRRVIELSAMPDWESLILTPDVARSDEGG